MSRALSTVLDAVEERVRTRGLFTGDALAHAKSVLVELLEASVCVRSPQRAPNGGIAYEERPDNAIRLAAAVKLIELETGKAPQTVEVSTTEPGAKRVNPQNITRMVLANPALARAVMTQIIDSARSVQAEVSDVPSEAPKVEKRVVSESQSAGSTR